MKISNSDIEAIAKAGRVLNGVLEELKFAMVQAFQKPYKPPMKKPSFAVSVEMKEFIIGMETVKLHMMKTSFMVHRDLHKKITERGKREAT